MFDWTRQTVTSTQRVERQSQQLGYGLSSLQKERLKQTEVDCSVLK